MGVGRREERERGKRALELGAVRLNRFGGPDLRSVFTILHFFLDLEATLLPVWVKTCLWYAISFELQLAVTINYLYSLIEEPDNNSFIAYDRATILLALLVLNFRE
jgi:hypothetical protein